MKKMIQRMIGLAAALSVVLSMTVMVCNAEYVRENEDDKIQLCNNAEINNSIRD